MRTQRLDFEEFYRSSREDCLRTVVVIVGDQDSPQELVAEAFTRAGASGAPSAGTRRPRRGWCAPRCCGRLLGTELFSGYFNSDHAIRFDLIYTSSYTSGAG